MTFWQRVRRTTAWGLYLAVLAGIATAVWQLVMAGNALAIPVEAAGIVVLLLAAPRRTPERIP